MNDAGVFINNINLVLSQVFLLNTNVYSNSELDENVNKQFCNSKNIVESFSISIEFDITSSFSFLIGFSEHAITYLKNTVHKPMQKIYDSFITENIYLNVMGVFVCNMEMKLEKPIHNFKYELPKKLQKENFLSLFTRLETSVVGTYKNMPIICAGITKLS